jgi:hypothetical protein
MRKLSIVCFLFLALTAGIAAADTSAGDKKPPKGTTGKAKTGDACKSSEDCDQSGRSQRCRESKCEPMPVHPVT